MKENDYIAEYIKEKRPEILTSPSFIFWKMAKIAGNTLSGIAKILCEKDFSTLEEAKEIVAKMAAGDEEKPIVDCASETVSCEERPHNCDEVAAGDENEGNEDGRSDED